jgi:hypothetical protein
MEMKEEGRGKMRASLKSLEYYRSITNAIAIPLGGDP